MLSSQSVSERINHLKDVASTVQTVGGLQEILQETKMSFEMQRRFWSYIPDRHIPVTTVADAVVLRRLIPTSKGSNVWSEVQRKIKLIDNNPPGEVGLYAAAVGKIFDTFESYGLSPGHGLVEYMIAARDYKRLRATPTWICVDKMVSWVIQNPELWTLIQEENGDENGVEVCVWKLTSLAPFFPDKVLAYVARGDVFCGVLDLVGALAPHLESHQGLVDLLCKEADRVEGFSRALPSGLSELRPTVNQLRQLLEAYPNKWENILKGIPSLTATTIDRAIELVEGENPFLLAALAPHRWLPSEASTAKYLSLCVDAGNQTPTRAAIDDLTHKARNGQYVESLKRVIEHCTSSRSIADLKSDLITVLDWVPRDRGATDAAKAAFRHASNLHQPTHPGVVAVYTTVFGMLCYHVDLEVWHQLVVECEGAVNAIAPDLYRVAHDTGHPCTKNIEALLIKWVLCNDAGVSGESLSPCTRAFTIDVEGPTNTGPKRIRRQALAALACSPLRIEIIADLIRADAPHIETTILYLVDRVGLDTQLTERAVEYLVTLGERDQTEDDTRLLTTVVKLLEKRFACDFDTPTNPLHAFKQWWDHMWVPTVDWQSFIRAVTLNRSAVPEQLLDLGRRICVISPTTSTFVFDYLYSGIMPLSTYYWLCKHWETNPPGRFLVETARFIPAGTRISRNIRAAMVSHMLYNTTELQDKIAATQALMRNPLCAPIVTLTTGLGQVWSDSDGFQLTWIMSTMIDDDYEFVEAYMCMWERGVIVNGTTVAFWRLMFDNAALIVESSQDPRLLIDFIRSYNEPLVAKTIREWLVNKKYSSEWRKTVLRRAVAFDIAVEPDLPEGALQAEDIPTDTGKPWPKCFLAAVAYTEEEKVEFVEEPRSTSWF